jgi:protein phosphatase
LYRALGQGELAGPDVVNLPLPHRSTLLLCSDGMWGVVPEKLIVNTLKDYPSPDKACARLVDLANQAGGPDNISVIAVRLP